MNLEELSKKENVSEQEVFDYFEVKNKNELKNLIMNKCVSTDINENMNGDMLYVALDQIYERFEESEYNTIQERVMFFAVVLNAFDILSISEFMLMVNSISPFEILIVLERELGEKEEVRYYKELYNEYKENQEKMSLVVKNALEHFNTTLEENIQNFDPEQLDSLIGQAKKDLDKLKK